MNTIKNLSSSAEKVVFKPTLNVFNKYLAPILKQDYVKIIILYITIVSIILSVNHLPSKFKEALDNPISKTLITLLCVYVYTEDLFIALSSTVGLIVLYYLITYFKLEFFDLVAPEPNIYPGCVNIKVSDLLTLFGGDKEKLKIAMFNYGVPLNVELSDYNAPLIATYFMSHVKVTDTCTAPN